MIEKKEIQYENFGRCLELSNGIIRIVVTLDFGPRILCYSFVDGENLFFEDRERVFAERSADMDAAYGKGAAWLIYGGHRLWIAPEDFPGTYYPDNDPVRYELTDCGAVFTPPMQTRNRCQFVTEVTLCEQSSRVTVCHTIQNCGSQPITLAPWAISVMAPGGTEIVPQPGKKTGATPNRIFTLWDYADMTDPRFAWLHRYMVLQQDPSADGKFKFGINAQDGYSLYFRKGDLFIKQFPVEENGIYPDHGMSFETYTNPLFLEIESLGQLQTLAPENRLTHTETWSLYKEDLPVLCDESIDSVIQKYFPSAAGSCQEHPQED